MPLLLEENGKENVNLLLKKLDEEDTAEVFIHRVLLSAGRAVITREIAEVFVQIPGRVICNPFEEGANVFGSSF